MLEYSTVLTQERLKEVLDYDPITGLFTWKMAISTTIKIGDQAGSLSGGYIRINVGGISYGGHNLAWLYMYGQLTMVDHKDSVGWHNWINNLRKTNYQLNAANRRSFLSNSGIKGVHERNGRYEVGIKVNQKRIYLGIYDSLEEAADAYMKAALYHFGEFARG